MTDRTGAAAPGPAARAAPAAPAPGAAAAAAPAARGAAAAGAGPAALLDAAALEAWVAALLAGEGMRAGDAAVAATVLVRSDLRGRTTHGVGYLPWYVARIRDGHIRVRATPRVVEETAVTAVLDGDAGCGQVVACRATTLALEKAAGAGVAVVLVRNSNHFGAAGHYALMCAEAGAAGLVVSNTEPHMAAPGSPGRVVGNSPTAYGFPDPDGLGPVVLDVSFGATSGSWLVERAARGEPIPEGLLLDAEGRPTTDPEDYVSRGGALLPAAGHKGFGLAIFAEVLAGVLAGAAFGRSMPRWGEAPEQVGHAIVALDVERFMPRDRFAARLAQLRRELHGDAEDAGADPAAPGAPAPAARLPGEAAHRREQAARRDGLPLDAVTWSALRALARDAGSEQALLAAARARRHAG